MGSSVLSKDSLSFTIAATVVTTLLQLASINWPSAPTSFWWALSVSAALGVFILVVQFPRPEERQRAGRSLWWDTVQPAIGYVGIGVLNILIVTAAVLGVGSAVEEIPVDTPLTSAEFGAP